MQAFDTVRLSQRCKSITNDRLYLALITAFE